MSEEAQEVLQQEVIPEAAPVENAAPPESETPAAPEDDKAEAKTEEDRKFSQKDMDEAIQKRLARESRKLERQIRAEMENKVLREQLANIQSPKSEQQNGEPKPEQFKTYEEYLDKLTDWKVEKRMEAISRQTAEQRQIQAQQSHEGKIRENLSKAADKYEDFEEVISNPTLPITIAMRDAIGESEIGGDIAYYLGINIKEAESIANMSPVAQIKAIDRLEQKLKDKPPVRMSNAPAPISPVTAKGGARTMDTTDPRSIKDMSTSEWIAAENKREKARLTAKYK